MAENVATYLEKNTALSAKLDVALQAIKAVKDQMWIVREAVCKLDAAREDSCNAEQLVALNQLPSDGEVSGLERFNSETDAIRDRAFGLYIESNELFEKGIKLAGIQAAMNIS
ncbi:MAG: hypothetical protein AAFQ37_02130, partial [Bacteroidota bacterium]